MALPVFILIVLSILLLSFSIFLCIENRKRRYRSIYKLAGMLGLPALLIIGVFFYIPSNYLDGYDRMRGVPSGLYVNAKTNDTIRVTGRQFEFLTEKPSDKFKTSFSLTETARSKRFLTRYAEAYGYLSTHQVSMDNYRITLTPDPNLAAEQAQPKKGKRKKTAPRKKIEIVYDVIVRDSQIFLSPKNDKEAGEYKRM